MRTFSWIISIVVLVIVVVSLIDASARPAWAWERAGQNKTLWIVLLVVGIPCGLIGLVASVIYAGSIRPRVAAAQSSPPPPY